MSVIARSLVAAATALVSVSLLVDAPVGVSALEVSPKFVVRDVQRAAAHAEHARMARRGSSTKAARCAARTSAPTSTTSSSHKATSTSSSKSSKSTDSGSSSSGSSDKGSSDSGGNKDDSGSNGDSGSSSSHSSGGSKPSLGAKKGLAWSNGEDSHLSEYVTSHVGYIYTWGPTCPSEAKGLGLKEASMLWGPDGSKVSDFAQNYMDYDFLMGFNEADLSSQADINPGWAWSLWSQYFLPNKDSKYLVTPSVTSAPSGLTWMQQFFQICEDNAGVKFCGADAVSLHYYGTSAGDLIDYVTNFRAAVGYPDIWLTEFACQEWAPTYHQCSSDETWAMMEGVVGWAENTDWVKMYSPFGMLHDLGDVSKYNSLMTSGGDPTDLAYYYINTT